HAPEWFALYEFTKLKQLINTYVVRLHRTPYRIQDWRTLIGVADGVFPIVGRDKIATWHSEDRTVHFFHSAKVSARNPLMLSAGINETAPTAKLPFPLATISKRASVVSISGFSVK